jgi:predicted dehydrogenase
MTLRVGIAGLGSVAMVHLSAYRKVVGIEVVGVADPNPERVTFASIKLGLPAYSTVGDLIKSAKPDICCILTPPASHEIVTLECAEAGVHVFCEKPMALSLRSCQSMIEVCRKHNVRLCYGASYRYLPAIEKAREMILGGVLGETLLLREHAVGGCGPESRRVLSHAHYPTGGPGGSSMGLCDHGIHLIDAFGWMMQSHVTNAWGRGNISGQPLRPEYAILRFANQAVGHLLYEDGTYSTDLPSEGMFSSGMGWSLGKRDNYGQRLGGWDPHPGCIYVYGTRGALRIFHYANALYHCDESGIRGIEVPNRPAPAQFTSQMQAFVDAIQTGKPTPVEAEEGLIACRVLLEIYDSALAST